MNANVEAVLGELEELEGSFEISLQPKFAQKKNAAAKTVRLWSVPRTTGQLLNTIVTTAKPKTILELGTSAGYSTIWMAAATQEYGGKIFTVDSSHEKMEMAAEYFYRAGVADCIEQIEQPIAEALAQWNRPIDMLFMDADKKNYLSFFQRIEPHLSDGALIVADDAIDIAHAMQDFFAYIDKSTQYISQIISIDHGLFFAYTR